MHNWNQLQLHKVYWQTSTENKTEANKTTVVIEQHSYHNNTDSKFYSQTVYNLSFIITRLHICKVTDAFLYSSVRTKTSITDETTPFLQLLQWSGIIAMVSMLSMAIPDVKIWGWGVLRCSGINMTHTYIHIYIYTVWINRMVKFSGNAIPSYHIISHIICKIYSAPITLYKTLHSS